MWRHQKILFAFQHFHDHISVEHDGKPPHTKFDMNRFRVAQDMATWIPNLAHWNQCKFGLVHNCLEPGQFALISMGLSRYSCRHISGPPWTDSHQIWAEDVFLSCSTETWYPKCWNAKKVFCDVITSVLYYKNISGLYHMIICDIHSHTTRNFPVSQVIAYICQCLWGWEIKQ